MAKRRPINFPKQNPASTTPQRRGGAGRSRVVPTQTRISYNDVHDLSTPQGVSKLNDEIRRIALAVDARSVVDEVVAAAPQAGVSGGQPDGTISRFAQSYFDDGQLVIGDQVARVNFVDSNTVKFTVSQNTSGSGQGVDISAQSEGLSAIVGDVLINRLPLDPATRPSPDNVSNDYLYERFNHTPDNGFYGWYCYGTIFHGLGLANRNNYILNIIDSQIIDDTGLTDAESASYRARFADMITEPYHEGLDPDNVIIRAVFKPDLAYYAGSQGPQTLDYIDQDARILRTNIIFRYVLIGA